MRKAQLPSGPALMDQMRRLREAVAGQQIPGESDYLAAITAERAMAMGTTAPLIGTTFAQMTSGLWAPTSAAAGAAPIDLIQVYITASEIFGVEPDQDIARDHLARVSLEDTLVFCAGWLNARHRAGANRLEIDRAFARECFQGPAQIRALALLNDPMRVLIAPQILLAMIKLSCFVSGDAVLERVQPGSLPLAHMVLAEHFGARDDVPTAIVSGQAGSLGRELIANQVFHAHRSEANAMARMMRRWIELPVELEKHPRVVDLLAAYEESTGASLLDLVCVVLALRGSAENGRPRVGPDYFAPLNWEDERLERTLAMFVVDLPHLRAAVRAEVSRHGIEWAIRTFEEFPVVRMPDRSFMVLDPRLLMRRIFSLMPLYDITARLAAAGDIKRKSRVRGCFEHVGEAYALEVIDRIAPTAMAVRSYNESAQRSAYGVGRQIADVALDYGDSWVVIEVTGSAPRRETVCGQSDASISADLDKLVAKARQLESSICAIRADEAALTGVPRSSGVERRFHPVLVVTDGFPVNPITLTLLRERLAKAGLLQHADTGMLDVIDLEELEMVEQIQVEGGPSLCELLAGKDTVGVMANAALRDYILLSLRLNPNGDERLRGRADRLFRLILDRNEPKAA